MENSEMPLQLKAKEAEMYQNTLRYIDGYWKNITFSFKKDKGIFIGLPNKFVSPNAHVFKDDQFYWDSYFTILALVVNGREDLAKGMIENFIYLFKRFGVIPSRNRMYNVGISQPPFLTSMIFEVFEKTGDKKWLLKSIEVAERELIDYWRMNREEKAERHEVYEGLSRYCDHNITHLTAEHESGWDMTSRFRDDCLHILPVDLNCLLYKYEIDIARAYEIVDAKKYAKKISGYKKFAAERKKTVNELMWNEKKGFFFDFNYVEKKQVQFFSVAGFYPLWCGMATDEQAERVRKSLSKLEEKGGVANTQKEELLKPFRQWDYPNGWACQQYIINRALRNYGFMDDAVRLARKWLNMNARVFEQTGKMWEKYNVVKAGIGKEERYVNQYGFGWTNAIFVRLYHDLIDPTNVKGNAKKSS